MSAFTREFNRVKTIAEQNHYVPKEFHQAVGECLVQHGLHTQYGLALVHRHNDLAPGHAMVHVQTADEDICTITDLHHTEAHPHTFFMSSEGAFIPLEYTAKSPGNPPPAEFLRDFSNLLNQHGLEDRLGITLRDDEDGVWIERELEDGTGTIAVRSVTPPGQVDMIETAWAYSREGGHIKHRVLRQCTKEDTGGHRC